MARFSCCSVYFLVICPSLAAIFDNRGSCELNAVSVFLPENGDWLMDLQDDIFPAPGFAGGFLRA